MIELVILVAQILAAPQIDPIPHDGGAPDPTVGAALAPTALPAENPSREELLARFRAGFETAFPHDDEEELWAIVERNADFTFELVRDYVRDHVVACIERGKVLDERASPALDKALRLASIYADLAEKPRLREAVETVEQYSFDQIRRKMSCELLRSTGEEHFHNRRLSAALEAFGKCCEGSQELDDPLGLSLALLDLGTVELERGYMEKARPLLERALVLTEELGDLSNQTTCLTNLGALSYYGMQLQRALSYQDQALALARRTAKSDEVTRNQSARAVTLHALGQTREAVQESERLIAHFKGTGNARSACMELGNLALFLLDEGSSLHRALEVCEEALELAESSRDPSLRGNALRTKGEILLRLGRSEETLKCLSEALAVSEAEGDIYSTSESLSSIVAALWTTGDYAGARREAELAINRLGGNGNPMAEISLRNHMALATAAAGEIEASIGWIKEAVRIADRLDSPPLRAHAYGSLALLLAHQDRYDEALKYARRALALVDRPDLTRSRAIAHKNLGLIYMMLNRPDKARDCFTQCVAALEEDPDGHEYLLNRSNQALCLTNLEEYESAEEIYRATLVLAKEKGLRPLQAKIVGDLAAHYLKRRLFDQALEAYQEAAGIHSEMSNLFDSSIDGLHIAETRYRLGQREEAAELLGELVSLDIAKDLPSLRAYTLGLLATIRMEKGELEEALRGFVASLEVQERLMRETRSLSDLTRSTFAERFNPLLVNAITCCESLYREKLEAGYLTLAVRIEEHRKARMFLESLARGGAHTEPALPAELETAMAASRGRIAYLQGCIDQQYSYGHAPSAELLRACRDQLAREQLDLEDLLEQARSEDPERIELRDSLPFKVENLQAVLDPSTLFLSYALGEREGVVIAVTNEQLTARRLQDIPLLEEKARALLAILEHRSDDVASFARLARDLYLGFLAPVEDLITGKSRIIASPDGIMHFLPLDMLLYASPSQDAISCWTELPYLVKRCAVSYVPSAAALGFLLRRQAGRCRGDPERDSEASARLDLLAVGGVEYADPATPSNKQGHALHELALLDTPRGSLKPLPHSRTEVEAIAQLFAAERVSLLLGEAATERGLARAELGNYRILHFATHALVDPATPYLSGIVLGPSHDEDGYWRVFEVQERALRAELVVLSACRTHVGRCISGEGVFGLVRAFLCAGADSVIATNWEVDDSFTASFMKPLYENLIASGLPRWEALWRAKLGAVQGALGKTARVREGATRGVERVSLPASPTGRANPRYWAAFGLYGLP
ncbi:MAG: CHAT domain-containing tetratricopeptide repeat protein [Planctomycetota bacterium]